MGITQAAQPFLNAYLYEFGNFGIGNEIQDLGKVAGNRTIELKPWALPGANRAAKFTDPVTGEVYYLQYRTPVGYDKLTAVGNNQGVQILTSGGDRSESLLIPPNTHPYTANGGYYNPNLSWQSGSTFVTAGGTRVTVGGMTGSTAYVTIEAPAAFNDIYGSGFRADITWMAQHKLTTGYPDGSFHPFDPMARDAMAAFMYRLAGSPAFVPPTTSPFTDLSPTDMFYKEITWMSSVGLTMGYPDGTFRPSIGMARDAMAAFLYRYATAQCHNPAATAYAGPKTAKFTDVPAGTQFYQEIGWLADAGITTGYSDGTYKPLDTITREAMAAFIHRLSSYTAANGGCTP